MQMSSFLHGDRLQRRYFTKHAPVYGIEIIWAAKYFKSVIDIILVEKSRAVRYDINVSADAHLGWGSTRWFGRRTNMEVDYVDTSGVDIIVLPDGQLPSALDLSSDSAATQAAISDISEISDTNAVIIASATVADGIPTQWCSCSPACLIELTRVSLVSSTLIVLWRTRAG